MLFYSLTPKSLCTFFLLYVLFNRCFAFTDTNRIWRSNLQSLVLHIPSPSLIWTPSRTKEFLTSSSWTPKSSTTTCETRRLRLPPAFIMNGRSARCYSTLFENLHTSKSAAFIELYSFVCMLTCNVKLAVGFAGVAEVTFFVLWLMFSLGLVS